MARARFKISEETQDKTITLGINTRWVKIDKIVSRRLQDRKTLIFTPIHGNGKRAKKGKRRRMPLITCRTHRND